MALCTAVGVPAGCTAASPAIDAGDQAVCAAAPVNNLDQRGFVRPGTGHTQCSIGAYEADATAPQGVRRRLQRQQQGDRRRAGQGVNMLLSDAAVGAVLGV